MALGCEIAWSDDRSEVTIGCISKIDELLKDSEFDESRPRTTPLEPGSKLQKDLCE